MADSKGEQLLDRLREYVQEQGERNFLIIRNQPLPHSLCVYFDTNCNDDDDDDDDDDDGCTSLNNTTGTGGELAPGWRVEVKTRNSGTSAGTSDAVSQLHCVSVWSMCSPV